MKRAIRHIAMLMKSTTFWTSMGIVACETLKGFDPQWLAERPAVRAVILPGVAALAVIVKLGQNQVLYLGTEKP